MTKLVSRASPPPTKALDDIVWNILGQTYTLKQQSDASMALARRCSRAGRFVPPHIHPHPGRVRLRVRGPLDLWLDGEQNSSAGPGDLVRLPMNEPHGLFNNAAAPVRCLFWVAPARKLPRLVRQAPQPARSGGGGSHRGRTRGQFPAAEIMSTRTALGKVAAGEFPSKGSSHVGSSHVRSSRVHEDYLRSGAISDQELAEWGILDARRSSPRSFSAADWYAFAAVLPFVSKS